MTAPRPSLLDRALGPIDPSGLAAFRVAFGAIMTWQVVRYALGGWIDEYYVAPAFHFTFHGFGWVRPLPALGMYLHFVLMGIAALALTVGYRARPAALLLGLGAAYVFLLEKARYLNHAYLIVLLALLLAAVPCNRALAWDARRGRLPATVPRWSLELLRAQIGLVYLFAAIAKLNPDWLAGEPLGHWLAARADHPVLGGLLAWRWAGLLFSWGGLLIDLAAWPLLVWHRTRLSMFLVLTAFHLTNVTLFSIGVFPWTMIAATTLFFRPDWPRRLVAAARGAEADGSAKERPATGPDVPPRRARRWPLGLAGAYLVVQLLVPLRHLAYPGSVHWTEEGHNFSWHMKLRDKDARVTFLVRDPEQDRTWVVDPREELTAWQVRKMCGRPAMIHQYAHHLADRSLAEGHASVEVRATVRASLNGREHRLLVDPSVDLAAAEVDVFRATPWILPLDAPLVPTWSARHDELHAERD